VCLITIEFSNTRLPIRLLAWVNQAIDSQANYRRFRSIVIRWFGSLFFFLVYFIVSFLFSRRVFIDLHYLLFSSQTDRQWVRDRLISFSCSFIDMPPTVNNRIFEKKINVVISTLTCQQHLSLLLQERVRVQYNSIVAYRCECAKYDCVNKKAANGHCYANLLVMWFSHMNMFYDNSVIVSFSLIVYLQWTRCVLSTCRVQQHRWTSASIKRRTERDRQRERYMTSVVSCVFLSLSLSYCLFPKWTSSSLLCTHRTIHFTTLLILFISRLRPIQQ
jgi:hypothetical protein